MRLTLRVARWGGIPTLVSIGLTRVCAAGGSGVSCITSSWVSWSSIIGITSIVRVAGTFRRSIVLTRLVRIRIAVLDYWGVRFLKEDAIRISRGNSTSNWVARGLLPPFLVPSRRVCFQILNHSLDGGVFIERTWSLESRQCGLTVVRFL